MHNYNLMIVWFYKLIINCLIFKIIIMNDNAKDTIRKVAKAAAAAALTTLITILTSKSDK